MPGYRRPLTCSAGTGSGRGCSHEGTDYAALPGTPIKAAGNGRVQFAGWKGGYGRTVVLQHGDNISTLYAHMSKLGKGIKNGTG